MKAELCGGIYTVALDMRDVDAFAARWPCYGERSELAFEYDARNGDLLDVQGEHVDDNAGVTALSNDAALAGAIALDLPAVIAMRSDYGDAESVATLLAAL